jgi:4-amino-4-deoxy-L-arabinose transferase-like glycosyltransferase
MTQKGKLVRAGEAFSRIRPLYLILLAALLHLILTVIIYTVGSRALLPGMFDPYGTGIFATDTYVYRLEAIALSRLLTSQGVGSWLSVSAPFHVKLYSLCYAVFGPVFGLNVLSVEPLNLLYYLAILTLVFLLGREVFDRRTGLLAAVLVALWPSLLLHTTQLLRDPLFILAMLALVLVYAKWLKKARAWPQGLLSGAVGGIVVVILWANRSNVWDVVVSVVLLGGGLVILSQLRERRVSWGNILGLCVLLVVTLSVPKLLSEPPSHVDPSLVRALAQDQDLSVIEGLEEVVVASAQADESAATPPLWDRLWARIKDGRARFKTEYANAGSNIDTDVQFNSMGDVIRYLPRAVVIGFFAPFPRMWFEAGEMVGVSGRLLSGMETLVMYVVEVLALFGLWHSRRRLSAWLLALVASLGLVAFGLVVLNVATLYRMRYTFWMLLIIISAQGAVQLCGMRSEGRREGRLEEVD